MRNLKRALSLALASVMLMGMMVVGTGAVSYGDDAAINYKEAADVLQAAGIMVGDDQGNFNPDQPVTRAQMAVVMANLLALRVSDFKGVKPFTDVPDWAVPYVAACYADGITSGIGNGQYGSNNTVSAVEASLMILKALGYFQNANDFGEDWKVAVIKKASEVELFGDLDVGVDSPLTREMVAYMVLQALQLPMVEVDSESTNITIGDITISGGSTKYKERAARSSYNKIIDDDYMQLGESLFKGDLKLNENTEDDYGRPAIQWTYKNDTVGTYAKEADATYTKATKVRDIYSDLSLDGTVAKKDITLYVDGEDASAGYDIVKRGDDKYGAQGAQMDVYYDDDAGEVTICVINTFLAIVTDDDYTQDGDDGILVQVYGDVAGSYFVENGNYEQDTVILVQVADDEIQAVVGEPKTVNGSLTRISSSDEVTADGTKYAKADQFTEADDDVVDGVAVADLKIDSDITYTLYLDQHGNYIAAAVAEDDAASDLVYVYSKDVFMATVDRKNVFAPFVTVVHMDGTVEEYRLGDKDDTSSVDAAAVEAKDVYKNVTAGDFAELKYDEDDDVYTLSKEVNDEDSGSDYTSASVPNNTKFEDDDARVKFGSTVYYLDNNTSYIFITKDGDDIDKVEVITGGINYTATTAAAGKAAYASGRDVEYVVFVDGYEADTGNVIYFKENTGYKGSVDKDVFSFEGYALGETAKTEFDVAKVNGVDPTKSTKLGGFYKYSETSDGYLKLTYIDGTAGDGYTSFVDDEDSYFKATSIDEIKKGILTFDEDDTAMVSSAVVVDLTNADKASENTYGRKVSSVSTLQRLLENKYTVTAELFINKDNEVEAIFITKIDDGPSTSGGGETPEVDNSIESVVINSDKTVTVKLVDEIAADGTAKTIDVVLEAYMAGEWVEAASASVTIAQESDTGSTEAFNMLPSTIYRAVCGGVQSKNFTTPAA